MIALHEVSKHYASADGPVRAVDGVSLTVDAGEFVALRGASGSGKSTLLMLVAGLTTPTAGKVVVAGRELPTLGASQLDHFRASTIGFVFQQFHLVPYLSVLDNVQVPPAEGPANLRKQRSLDLLERCGLTHRLRHRPDQLSTGERQRVAVARALVNQPQLILADEPTGNLDPASAAAVLSMLHDFQSGGGTILMVTHEDDVAAHAGRVVHLEAGRLATPPASIEAD